MVRSARVRRRDGAWKGWRNRARAERMGSPARRPPMGRGDTSDAQWRLIEPLLPKQKRGGRWNDHRLMFDGILWVLRTGAPWRDLPERYGAWGSVYHRFNRWK